MVPSTACTERSIRSSRAMARTVLVEQASEAEPVVLPEAPERVVVGSLSAGQPQIGQLLAAGRFELAGRADPVHETVEPDAEQRPGMVGAGAHPPAAQVDADLRPLRPGSGNQRTPHTTRAG